MVDKDQKPEFLVHLVIRTEENTGLVPGRFLTKKNMGVDQVKCYRSVAN
mgnify:CR=1